MVSVLIAVRCADAAYQVLPISATDGGFSSLGAPPVPMPGGHGAGFWNTSRSRNRVLPTSASSDEPSHRERHRAPAGRVLQRRLDVGPRLVEPVGHPRVPVAAALLGGGRREPVDVRQGERLQPDVTAGRG